MPVEGGEVTPFVQLVEGREDLREVHDVVVGAVVLEPPVEEVGDLRRGPLVGCVGAQSGHIGVPSTAQRVHRAILPE